MRQHMSACVPIVVIACENPEANGHGKVCGMTTYVQKITTHIQQYEDSTHM
jgi:hypothetical protein